MVAPALAAEAPGDPVEAAPGVLAGGVGAAAAPGRDAGVPPVGRLNSNFETVNTPIPTCIFLFFK